MGNRYANSSNFSLPNYLTLLQLSTAMEMRLQEMLSRCTQTAKK
jgi:hypothetical protein